MQIRPSSAAQTTITANLVPRVKRSHPRVTPHTLPDAPPAGQEATRQGALRPVSCAHGVGMACSSFIPAMALMMCSVSSAPGLTLTIMRTLGTSVHHLSLHRHHLYRIDLLTKRSSYYRRQGQMELI